MNSERHIAISLFVVIFSFLSWQASAQIKAKNVSKKAIKLYNESQEQLQWDRFEQAKLLLIEAISISPEFSDALYLKADLEVFTGKFEKAERTLHRLTEVDPGFSNRANFLLGEALFYQTKYSESKLPYDKYLKGTQDETRHTELVRLQLRHIPFAIEAMKNPVPFHPKDMGPNINTSFDEYFPALTADESELYFTRLLEDGKHVHEDILKSIRSENDWALSQNIGAPVNTPYNEGAHTISPDGRFLIFTACENPMTYGGCDIYISVRMGDQWSVPKNMGPNINSRFKETQPSISSDGKLLYFVSNQKGGHGKFDIWVSRKQADGHWAQATNLGTEINTPHFEERPFIHPDNETLYFSSTGHPGMGGSDLFVSRKQTDGTWGKPVNLGYPINSVGSENGIFVNASGQEAFFASEQINKTQGLDLFEFELPDQQKPNWVTYVKGKVIDSKSKRPLSASIELTDLLTGEVVSTISSDKKNGRFLSCLSVGKDYAYNVSRNGYLFYSENFSLANYTSSEPFALKIELQKLTDGGSVVLKNIFFKTNSSELEPKSTSELNRLFRLLSRNLNLKIEISGHTDSTGNEPENVELSTNRAKVVFNYLVEEGIDKGMLSFKGFGSSKPIASNETEEGKAQNRRTEFRVVE